MPIYEFKCNNCHHRMEKLCSIGESGHNLQCPQCGKTALSRVMSSFSYTGSRAGGTSCNSCSSGSCSSCTH
ncbi:MAG: zinc ribbon domain-containing protein [Peptococcaceae bacterium]|nr:zinc ribbon domain-containing protein [Peptococcaceae bacterium]